jgi:hypothetical protein
MVEDIRESLEGIMPKIIKVLSATSQECFLIVGRRGLEFLTIDEDQCFQVSISINKELIKEWHVRSEHILRVSTDILRNIFYSRQPMTGVKDLKEKIIEIRFGERKNISLYIYDEGNLSKLKLVRLQEDDELFSIRIPSTELRKFLKMVGNASDELIFETKDGENIRIKAEYLNCSLLGKIKPISIKKTASRLRFSIPLKYLRILLPLLDLSEIHNLILMRNNIFVIEIDRSSRVKCRASVTSSIYSSNT